VEAQGNVAQHPFSAAGPASDGFAIGISSYMKFLIVIHEKLKIIGWGYRMV
jgi:hypothetical protein